MALKVLYIGGTGEISYACVRAGAELGQQVAVFNRGQNAEPLPAGVRAIAGDIGDEAGYRKLGEETWDVVCQFKAYDAAAVRRDAEIFGGKLGQYVFISSASVYQKPPADYVLTEKTPVGNPFWEYSRQKIEAEQAVLAAEKRLPGTIVRPSHTYRRNFPGTVIGGDDYAWRFLQGMPVIVHGDGASLWTYTAAEDFAWYFVRLLGNARAIGEIFLITAHRKGYTWDQIYRVCAEALGAEAKIVHVPTDTLVRCKPDTEGPLLGDKAWPTLFDNSKVRGLVGSGPAETRLEAGMNQVAGHVRKRLGHYQPDAGLHALLDRIIAEQLAVGGA